MDDNNNLTESLSSSLLSTTTGDDNKSSQSSLRSGGRSLLERIQLQREKEAAAATNAPPQIQVPNYANPVMEGHGGGGGTAPTTSSTPFWSSLGSGSATNGAGATTDAEMGDALLPNASNNTNVNEPYSMVNYFLTFVRDIHGLFMALPMAARVVVVLVLLYVAYKLL